VGRYGSLSYILLPALAVSSDRELEGNNQVNPSLKEHIASADDTMTWVENLLFTKVRGRAISTEVRKLSRLLIPSSSGLPPMSRDI
jgi:hypothetical protein